MSTYRSCQDSAFDDIEHVIADMRQGKMVLMVDDEHRENEADLIMAADCITPEAVNFMAKEARGLICLALSPQHCDHLKLPLMVSHNRSGFSTAFTVSIEAREGVTTGISAADRATTIRAAVAQGVQPDDLVRPGHIFPLRARPGGVLERTGHTEAGCDLARLAGWQSAAAIVEVMDEDGTMARGQSLHDFAVRHGLRIGTIADLVRYRLATEKVLLDVGHEYLDTVHGTFRLHTFEDVISKETHLALVMGHPQPSRPLLVHVHMTDPLQDLVGATASRHGHESSAWTLWAALERVAREKEGIVVILACQESSASMLKRAADGAPAYFQRTFAADRPGIEARILQSLGAGLIRAMGAAQETARLSGFGLQVVETVSVESELRTCGGR